MIRHRSLFAVVLLLFAASVAHSQSRLEQELLLTSTEKLAVQAEATGDAIRGAILFHSRTLGCAQCHRVDEVHVEAVGPNLAVWEQRPSYGALIESILRPSATINPKYASTRVLTEDGHVYSGVIASRDPEKLRLRVGPKVEDEIAIEVADIDQESVSQVSLMPAGLVQQLSERSQFFDLIAYVYEIAIGGPARANELMPTQEQLRSTVPEYESHVDHQGLISNWNADSRIRGERIYQGLCVNCHGTRDSAGSLPTALRFGKGKFKQGSDPYSMYRTLTHGTGFMLPQVWMVPKQKYDVIHYVREHFLKDGDANSYSQVDELYLKSLPRGDTFGPEPVLIQPWIDMDYGNAMATTIEFGTNGKNIAQKAIAFRLDPGVGGISKGNVWMAFEHDTMRWAAGWKGTGYINWEGIQFNGAHGIHPRAVGEIEFENPTGPGWANPETESYEDNARVMGRDGRRYGPLPKSWIQYLGMTRNNTEAFVRYSVDGMEVRESPFMMQSSNGQVYYGRSIAFDRSTRQHKMLIQTFPGKVILVSQGHKHFVADWERADGTRERFVAMVDDSSHCSWLLDGNRLSLQIAKRNNAARFAVAVAKMDSTAPWTPDDSRAIENQWPSKRLVGGSATPYKSNGESLPSPGKVWFRGNGWIVDELVPPVNNPWNARIRVTGVAFYPDQDAMAVCTWDGDIWRVQGLKNLDAPKPILRWERIATGLFQPLGILAYRDHLMVTCRDQLMKLEDRDGDGVIDEYGCFNNDHQVTEHFHEFAMGLQQDDVGNFYYAKSARHALPAVVPHHGTLLQVSPDGTHTEILATGFRAANGVCLNPDGTFIVTDQEGHWNPKNRINWVEKGKFYGNMFGYHSVKDSSDSAMEPPLCWITNSFDRSPAELLWADSAKWGTLNQSLLNLSYGYGRIYVVPFETVGAIKQGGMCALPIPDLPTGIIRGRFSPHDGQLYVGGMFAWASSRQEQEGGLFRIRRTGEPVHMPIALKAIEGPGVELGFSDPLDAKSSLEPQRYRIRVWDLKRTSNYGSDHLNEVELTVDSVAISPDGKSIKLTVPDLNPTWCMSIDCKLMTSDGKEIQRLIHNTIHQIP